MRKPALPIWAENILIAIASVVTLGALAGALWYVYKIVLALKEALGGAV